MNSYLKDKVLEVVKISKDYNGELIFKDISLYLSKGEFVSILGPSGIGKSTLFDVISGLKKPKSGKFLINGTDETERTGIVSYMHQKDLLLPWRTVVENGAVPLEIKGMKKKDAMDKVMEKLDIFGLQEHKDKYPSQLSGGMKQRASLLRTYMFSKEVMLLDEPFGGLDALTKHKMQDYLLKVQEKIKASILFITHDIEEAVFLSDRIYILNGNPARIVKEIQVNIERPRTDEMMSTIQFNNIKREIMTLL
ncbi:MAG: ABC transporter ATP-binding protein [Bacillota bacterium]|nr:ABC transporter ATP-binding protein [Bacillota bacterium]